MPTRAQWNPNDENLCNKKSTQKMENKKIRIKLKVADTLNGEQSEQKIVSEDTEIRKTADTRQLV